MASAVAEVPHADLEFADEDLPDLHELLRDLRTRSPVWWVRLFDRPTLLLLSYDLVHDAFADEQILPAATMYREYSEKAMGRMVLSMMGEEHRVHRAIISAPFRARVVPLYTDMIATTAEELVADIAALGQADLVPVFTKRFPLRVITRLLGLPGEREDELATWAMQLIRGTWEPEAALAAKANFTEFLTPILDDRRRQPAGDLISILVHTDIDGERLDDEDIYSFIRLLFPAGADTTYLGMGNVLLRLLRLPDVLELARSQPGQRRAIVEEGLRMDPSTGLQPRMSPPDRTIEWKGIRLEPSTSMIFAIMAANRDPDVFPDPDVFNPYRQSEKPPITFGFGTHYCIGNPLALLELTIGLGVLLERLPNIRLHEHTDARVVGTVLRGPTALPVRWDDSVEPWP